jgi:hypothetical protein
LQGQGRAFHCLNVLLGNGRGVLGGGFLTVANYKYSYLTIFKFTRSQCRRKEGGILKMGISSGSLALELATFATITTNQL